MWENALNFGTSILPIKQKPENKFLLNSDPFWIKIATKWTRSFISKKI